MRAASPRHRVAGIGRRCAVAVLALALGGVAQAQAPDARPTLTVGVLAYQDLAAERARWSAIQRVSERQLPGYRIRWTLLGYGELNAAIASRQVDIVITNPAHAVMLHHGDGASPPLATVLRRIGDFEVSAYGGVAVVRADSALQHWGDVAGRRVAIVHAESLGGRYLQSRELLRRGVPMGSIQWVETGPPHENVVRAVLDGRADVGFLRDGVLETLQAAGALDRRQIRVLERQDLLDYPYATSTPLYPDWAVVALQGVPASVRRDVTLALMSARDEGPSAPRSGPGPRTDRVVGFTSPQPYTAIERLLRDVRARPFGVPQLSWQETLRAQAVPIALAALATTALLAVVSLLLRQRRRLRGLLHEKSVMLDELAISARTFDSQLATLITDRHNKIVRVNRAFTEVTGYTADEVIGRSPRLLASGRHDAAFYRQMWQTLDEHGYWQGEIWNRRKNGEIYPEWLTISSIPDTTGKIRHYLAMFSDISWRKSAEQQIEQLAFYDTLTGLANRRLLLERLQAAIRDARRQRHWGAVLFLDLDHFKGINDTLGHDAGDAVLRETAQRLRHVLREQDTAGRLGGDEFLVLLPASHPDREHAAMAAQTVAGKLVAALRQPYALPEQPMPLSVSVGISLYCGQGETPESLLKEADLAMYEVKQRGRDGVCFFDPGMEAAIRRRYEMQQQLAAAIEAGELVAYCQPQTDAHGRIVGAEMLLRWLRPDGVLVPPAQFIPLAEDSGLIIPIGAWVLQQACATLKRWESHPALGRLRLAVNVSARQFKDAGFADTVRHAAAAAGIAPGRLELEITESVFLGDLDEAKRVLQRLDEAGFALALDDFGTGYSSLAYLAELPFDVIKIDQRFVARLEQRTREEEAIVTTIITLGRKLGMVVLAEGVETESQENYLIAHGCHQLQGYRYGRPMPMAQFEALVIRKTEHPTAL